jgi:hypothetical protein
MMHDAGDHEDTADGLRVEMLKALAEEYPDERFSDLPNVAPSDITNSTERSRGKRVQHFDYPPPDIDNELDSLRERLDRLSDVAVSVAALGLEGVDTQVQIAGLHEVSARAEKLAREIGLHAIAQGKMSQVRLGRLLGVHQATVSRWVNEATEQQDQ